VVIDGGPMMGRVVTDLAQPITKKTSGLIVLPRATRGAAEDPLDGARGAAARAVCCQCRMCTTSAAREPRHAIQPHLAMRSSDCGSGGAADVAHHRGLPLLPVRVCEVYACRWASPAQVLDRMRSKLIAAGQSSPHRREDVRPTTSSTAPRPPAAPGGAAGPDEQMAAADRVDWRRPRCPACASGCPSTPAHRRGRWSPSADRAGGELIAEIPEGKLGARQHASIGGRVAKWTSMRSGSTRLRRG